MKPEKAAEIILKKCFKNKFLIILSLDIFSLILLIKLTPVRLKNYILDKVFPMPD